MATNPQTDKPVPGNENVISDYYEGVKKTEVQGYEAPIKNARTALFVTAALVFISELVMASMAGLGITPAMIGIALAEAGVFVALGFWTKTKPFSAIIIGLVLFILMWVVSVLITDEKAIYRGIIMKVIIIVYLVKALKPAKAWEESKKNI